jgi:hypothetical protein
MQRTFAYYSITANKPQPLLGSFVTAAVAAGDNAVITVNDITPFVSGQGGNWTAPYVKLVEADGTKEERCTVVKVDVANKKITVTNLANARIAGGLGTASFIMLATNVQGIYIQPLDGNAAALFIGTSPLMSSTTGAFCIAKLVQVAAGVQPIDLSIQRSGAVDCEDPANLFILGTNTGDKYLPSLGVI